MPSILESICVTVGSGEFFMGFLVNGFIGLVNCIDWVRTRRMTPIDFILTGLAISRIVTLWALITVNFYIFSHHKTNVINIFSELTWNVSSHCSAWFGSCLNIFYFLKIANFSHPAFLWLKWRINKVVLRIMMGCLLISLFIVLLMTGRISEIQKFLTGQENKANITHDIKKLKILKFSSLILFNTISLVPFVLSLISCFLLVVSLWRHIQQMHLMVTGFRDPSTEAHVRAMRSTISFLCLVVLYHLGVSMAVSNLAILHNNLVAMFSLIVMGIYPLTHSIILILSHNKLRQASLRVLGKLKDCLQIPGQV